MKTTKPKLSKEQKFSKFQRDLEREKKLTIWAPIVLIIIIVAFIRFQDFWNGSVDDPGFIARYCFYGVLLLATVLITCLLIKISFNMASRQKELRETIKEKKEYLEKLKKFYNAISSLKFRDIPKETIKEPEYQVLANVDKTPPEVFEELQAEIDDMEIKLRAYHKSPERTFWHYAFSFKWLVFWK